MAARRLIPLVASVGSEPERILGNLTAATTDSTPITETVFAAQFARARRVDDLWWDELDVLHEQAMDDHVENQLDSDGIDEDEAMPEDDSSNESGYSWPTHDSVRRFFSWSPQQTWEMKARTSNRGQMQ